MIVTPYIYIYFNISKAMGTISSNKGYLSYIRDIQNLFELPAQAALYSNSIPNYLREKGQYVIKDSHQIGQRTVIVGKSLPMAILYYMINSALKNKSHVLILGATGTGKELIANALHYNSNRLQANSDYIAVNCGAIPKELIESELFGHVRGAFTGADRMNRGAFELAKDGTLHLDEIGDMPLDVQLKVLRVIQEKTVARIGDAGNKIDLGDIRFVASTHRDLAALIREGRFRDDLFHRLHQTVIYSPSLPERGRQDTELLVNYFLTRQNDGQVNSISDDALALLANTHIAGNVRGLENLVVRAQGIAQGRSIESKDLSTAILYERAVWQGMHDPNSKFDLTGVQVKVDEQSLQPEITVPLVPTDTRLSYVEKTAIEDTLLLCKGNKKAAAEMLGLSRRAFYRKLERHGIERFVKTRGN